MGKLIIKILQVIVITLLVFIIKGTKEAPAYFLQTGILKEKDNLSEIFIMEWKSGHINTDTKVHVTKETFNKHSIGEVVSFKRKGNFETYYNLPVDKASYQLSIFTFVAACFFLAFIELGGLMEIITERKDNYWGIISSFITFFFIDIKKLT